ncbi:MAG TPA: ferritin-like domain-containing protein [Polyangiaceae bacterium]
MAVSADACGSDECTVTRPNPLPEPVINTPGPSYDVTVSSLGACGIDAGDCTAICGQAVQSCTDDGSGSWHCQTLTYAGKARTSLRWRRRREASPFDEHLAAAVWLEAASIDAFYTLSVELAEHGAPRVLQKAALSAARDEERHTRAMREIAERHGVRARLPRRRTKKKRTLVELAIENAVEGCVHETFGAVLAAFQARRAGDPRVRRAMREIARDEARHAELAAAIARWADGSLDARERARVSAAKARASEKLMRSLASPTLPALAALGMPTAAEATAIAHALSARLWS